MANQISNESEDRWVNERLASLAPPAQWQPDTDRAFERVMQRRARGGQHKRLRLSMIGVAFASAVILVALPWNTLQTPKTEEPVNNTPSVQARQDSVPAFAAEINVVPAPARQAMGKPSPTPEILVFKPIPPLPGVQPAEAKFASQPFREKKIRGGRSVLAEAAAPAAQDSPQTVVTQPEVISKVQ